MGHSTQKILPIGKDFENLRDAFSDLAAAVRYIGQAKIEIRLAI